MEQLSRKKLDIETVRGKYSNGDEALFVDWRLQNDGKYDVSGK